MDRNELIYDWNVEGEFPPKPGQRIQLNDETLRDGLQSPSALKPSLDEMVAHLHNCAAVGINAINIGLPGAGPHVAEQCEVLAREIVRAKLPLCPNCAARTVLADIQPIAEISQKLGLPIEAATFIGSSTIRMEVEGWNLEFLVKCVTDALTFVKKEGLPAMFVTEDTVRAHPEIIRALYGTAIDLGAERLVVCDTTGHITPWGVKNLLKCIFDLIDEKGARGQVEVDWHGHMDRGLGVINNIAALEAGADRLHGTALGIGERAGNAPLDLMTRSVGSFFQSSARAWLRSACTFKGFRVSNTIGAPPSGGAYFIANPRGISTAAPSSVGSTMRPTAVVAELGGAGW